VNKYRRFAVGQVLKHCIYIVPPRESQFAIMLFFASLAGANIRHVDPDQANGFPLTASVLAGLHADLADGRQLTERYHHEGAKHTKKNLAKARSTGS
jgi:hypothetical protein